MDEFEVINDYDTIIQNGQTIRVPVTRQVRRPAYEIERERNQAYNRMRSEYDRAVADYRTYESEYNKRLTSWASEDQRRRQDSQPRESRPGSQTQ